MSRDIIYVRKLTSFAPSLSVISVMKMKGARLFDIMYVYIWVPLASICLSFRLATVTQKSVWRQANNFHRDVKKILVSN